MYINSFTALFTYLFLFCQAHSLYSQGDAKVAFTIDGEPVLQSEVLQLYTRLSVEEQKKLSFKDYLPIYIRYKLKVKDARRLGYDTLSAYKLQRDALYRGNQAKATTMRMHTDSRLTAFDHFSILVRQDAGNTVFEEAKTIIEKVYIDISNGSSAEAVRRKYQLSDQNVFGQTSEGVVDISLLLPEVATQVQHLSVGEFSSPFSSPLGWHIVFRKSMPMALQSPDMLSSSVPFSLEEERVVAEGLLAYFWDNAQSLPTSSVISDKDLNAYFEAHKKDYKWDTPRFSGGVIHCSDKKTAKSLRKVLKKLPVEKWAMIVQQLNEAEGKTIAIVEPGLYRWGENPYVDEKIFVGRATKPVSPDLPVCLVVGKKLKKARTYRDVYKQVLQDYKEQQGGDAIEELEKRYSVRILL